jgi:hypothetical protein
MEEMNLGEILDDEDEGHHHEEQFVSVEGDEDDFVA